MALISTWLNNQQPDQNGDIIAQIHDDQTGKVMSVYKGKSMEEVANQILNSSARASEEIGNLRRTRQPDQAPSRPQRIEPRPLSADDSFRISQNLMDPAKSSEAVAEVFTRTVGASPEVIGRTVAEVQAERERNRIQAECASFIQNNPDYYECQPNEDRLIQGLALKGWDVTRNNLELVYDELNGQGLLIQHPAQGSEPYHEETQQHPQQRGTRPGPNPPSEPNPPSQTTRPRHVVSTGIRSTDASAQRPRPTATAPKYTPESVARMSKDEYRAAMRDPAFIRAVDSFPRRA